MINEEVNVLRNMFDKIVPFISLRDLALSHGFVRFKTRQLFIDFNTNFRSLDIMSRMVSCAL